MSISQFPLDTWRRIYHYLRYYNYGCAEQRMSTLLPLLIFPDLKLLGVIDESIERDGNIEVIEVDGLKYWKNREEVLKNGFQALLHFQNPDGGFSYRTDGSRISSYNLSLYIYGGLLLAQTYGQDIPDDVIQSLERYLIAVPT